MSLFAPVAVPPGGAPLEPPMALTRGPLVPLDAYRDARECPALSPLPAGQDIRGSPGPLGNYFRIRCNFFLKLLNGSIRKAACYAIFVYSMVFKACVYLGNATYQ